MYEASLRVRHESLPSGPNRCVEQAFFLLGGGGPAHLVARVELLGDSRRHHLTPHAILERLKCASSR